MSTSPLTKFTLKQWIAHPTTILLITVSAVAWTVSFLYINSKTKEAENERKRADKWENQVFDYTNTILFKEATEKELKQVIHAQKTELDSLRAKELKK